VPDCHRGWGQGSLFRLEACPVSPPPANAGDSRHPSHGYSRPKPPGYPAPGNHHATPHRPQRQESNTLQPHFERSNPIPSESAAVVHTRCTTLRLSCTTNIHDCISMYDACAPIERHATPNRLPLARARDVGEADVRAAQRRGSGGEGPHPRHHVHRYHAPTVEVQLNPDTPRPILPALNRLRSGRGQPRTSFVRDPQPDRTLWPGPGPLAAGIAWPANTAVGG
jgi:hypothetical protein